MGTPIIIDGLTKVYNSGRADLAVRAVDGISFRVDKGDSLAIIGPSGCGKSSLLNILGCLDRPTEGRYELDGRDTADLDDDDFAALRNRHIGFVFQSFNLLPRMSAAENVELPLLYGAVKNSHELARHALERVGLADRSHHLPSELSGGQKQRVAIARAIVTRPSILLCDEPTGALDSRTGRDVLELLLSLNAEGSTLVMVTHDLSIARAMTRAIRMKDGRIVADGNAAAVVAEMHASELEEAC
ncbi:MAG TPA: ABC transporter ATP-binding protein [Polyangiaceae bacterium]|nr:ABC transporter ATP-binding protein [Polyangiaceae bacterium]